MEDAKAASNRHLAIATRIVGEAETWFDIAIFMIHKSGRNSVAFLDHSVVRVPKIYNPRASAVHGADAAIDDVIRDVRRTSVNRDRLRRIVFGRVEIKLLEGFHRVGWTEVRPAQAVIESQLGVHFPGVLSVEFELMKTERAEENAVALEDAVVIPKHQIGDPVVGVFQEARAAVHEIKNWSFLPGRLLAGLVVVEEEAGLERVWTRNFRHVIRPSECTGFASPSRREALVHQVAIVGHDAGNEIAEISAGKEVLIGKTERGLIRGLLRRTKINYLGKVVVTENKFVCDRRRDHVYQVPRPA